ncbi:NnrU family protein, partial [Chromobacterium violaceum]|uniref:NnrU family protein n=1 Tax=Chromobacterium violaceum TaxID=536 RepID=UPI00385D4EF4
MTLLVLGIAVFIGIHLLPTFAPTRHKLIGRMGEGGYKGMFSIVSAAGLALIIFGKAYAGFVPVWTPPA